MAQGPTNNVIGSAAKPSIAMPNWVGFSDGAGTTALQELTNPVTGETWTAPSGNYYVKTPSDSAFEVGFGEAVNQIPFAPIGTGTTPVVTPTYNPVSSTYNTTPATGYTSNYSQYNTQPVNVFNPNKPYTYGTFGANDNSAYNLWGSTVGNPYITQGPSYNPLPPGYRPGQPIQQPQQPGGGSSSGDDSFGPTQNTPEFDPGYWSNLNFSGLTISPEGLLLGAINPLLGLAYNIFSQPTPELYNPDFTQPTVIDFNEAGEMTYTNPNTGQSYTYDNGTYNSATEFQNETGIGDPEWDTNAPGFSWNSPNSVDVTTGTAGGSITTDGQGGATYSSPSTGDVSGTDYGGGSYGFDSGYSGGYDGGGDVNGGEVGYDSPGGDDGGGDSGGGGGSYIATATTQALGKEGLKVFEDWRDYMFNTLPTFTSSFGRYRVTAPKIVEEIDKKENSKEIYKGIWDKYLKPIFNIIKTDKDSKKALNDSKVMVREVSNKYLKGVSDGR